MQDWLTGTDIVNRNNWSHRNPYDYHKTFSSPLQFPSSDKFLLLMLFCWWLDREKSLSAKNQKRICIYHMPKTIESFIRSSKSVAMTYFIDRTSETICGYMWRGLFFYSNCWMWYTFWAEKRKRQIYALHQLKFMSLYGVHKSARAQFHKIMRAQCCDLAHFVVFSLMYNVWILAIISHSS